MLSIASTIIFSFVIAIAAQQVNLKGNVSINYISFENNCKSITFDYYDEKKHSDVLKNATMSMAVDNQAKGLNDQGISLYYNNNDGSVFVLSNNDIKANNCESLFKGWTKLQSATFNNFHTEDVTSMKNMFYGCTSLQSLDLSGFNTSKVTDMSYMFYMPWSYTWSINSDENSFEFESNLTNVTFGDNFTTASVTNMSNMFSGCANLTSLDVSKFNTTNVKTMTRMFALCKKITTLNVSGFNNNSVTRFDDMFAGCELLQTLNIDSDFITSKAVSLTGGKGLGMFSNCLSLKTLNLSNSNVSNVKYMSYVFKNCNALETLNISGWTTTNLEDMSEMFYGCKKLTTLDISNFNTANVFNMNRSFYGCEKISRIYVGDNWTNSKVDVSKNWGVDTFKNCNTIKGGTSNWEYNPQNTSATYARIGNAQSIGYLSTKS